MSTKSKEGLFEVDRRAIVREATDDRRFLPRSTFQLKRKGLIFAVFIAACLCGLVYYLA